jgi:hypothetical protein
VASEDRKILEKDGVAEFSEWEPEERDESMGAAKKRKGMESGS